ncbi:MAG: recombinase family protein, partial [Lachnospiraceae bacterium]|nr:recombinase family protein [Lachnospiraceae bacterium]
MKDIVGIYCRLSEEDRDKRNREDESESIQNQKSMLVTYACEKGWDIYNIYCDEDYAGSDRNRPQFNQMLRDAEAGKINIILCKAQARFSREMEIIEKYIHGYFMIWGTRFVSIVDNADTQNRGNKKARQINGLINEWFLEDLSDSIKSVLDDKRSKGLHIGSSVAYGYKKDPDHKGHIIIDEPAAAVVREIFALFISGVGKTEITRILNRRKIPNPSMYKYENGLYDKRVSGKCGGLWGYAVVARILSNEIYIGNMIQGQTGTISYKIQKKYRKPEEEWFYCRGTHEPIIEMEVWEKAQKLIKARATPRRDGTVSIYARKVRCAYCGYIMHTLITGGRRYLRCTSVKRMPGVCTGAFIPEKTLGNYVLEEFHKLQKRYLDEEAAQKMIQIPERQKDQKKQIKNEIAEIEKKKNK